MDQDVLISRQQFKSISLYSHEDGYLSFWYPTEWALQEFYSPHLTVQVVPDSRDPATNVTIEVKDLEEPLAEDEREIVVEGVREGLNILNACHIERWIELDESESGEWGLDWTCTFVDGGMRRRRRARLFFYSQYFYSVICQGATDDHYKHWQGMFEFVMLSAGVSEFPVSNWAIQQNWDETLH